jgi:tetrahydromethanopterin S-methyltransferase subunit A
MAEIAKSEPAADYPPEEGCYLRSNDYSPVAVAVILLYDREKTPPGIEHLVRTAVESGAALAGTIQTENIGIEKVICNLVANPNIRYLVVCGPESPGHAVGDAFVNLEKNGTDARKRIVGAKAPTPFLFNIPSEFVERFRRQVSVINLIGEGSDGVIRQAVCACYQETPTTFRDYALFDPGAYPEPALSGKITWRVSNPAKEPKNEKERLQLEKLEAMKARFKQAAEAKRGWKG